MATIKLEILLDSTNQEDVNSFSNLMHAFSGTPAVQILSSGNNPTIIKTERVENSNIVEVKNEDKSESIKEDAGDNTGAFTFHGEPVIYSEADLKAMDNATLKAGASELGIDYESEEGKNTSAKLIRLILKHYDQLRSTSPADTSETTEDEAEEAETSKEDVASESTGGVTLDELRALLNTKVDAHRDEIGAKVRSLGAKNLTTLAEEHYDEINEYLKSLD